MKKKKQREEKKNIPSKYAAQTEGIRFYQFYNNYLQHAWTWNDYA